MMLYKFDNTDYFVSKAGSVYKKDILLSQYDNGYGYKIVVLSGKPHFIHELLAQLYIPNPDNKTCVYHINGNIQDNRICNLKWGVSLQFNYKDLFKPKWKGGRGRVRGVRAIDRITGEIVKEFSSMIVAAKAMNVHPKSFYSAINKPHLCKGYKWEYI